MEQIVRARVTLDPVSRVHMYADFLNMWFRFEKDQLALGSPTLLEFMLEEKTKIIEVLEDW